MAQAFDFAALIGSRICHDLISPVGAINNGIELIQMTTPSLGPELALISDSVSNASARIRYFRIAFGAASAQMLGRAEVLSILKDVYADTRITVVWGPDEAVARDRLRLTFLAIMCLETAMPYGGRIEVTRQADGLTITGLADKFKIDEVVWSVAGGVPPSADLRPAQVQFGLLPYLAAQDGFVVNVKTGEEQVSVLITRG